MQGGMAKHLQTPHKLRQMAARLDDKHVAARVTDTGK
jgi:hypothetical protein